ncbi:MAG: NAD(P)-binding protein [Cytophagales bacterium]|nr:NAD(P)-binding protein [Cytophagales bacterium]
MSEITRRDFINGTLMVAGASVLPFGCTNPSVLDTLDPEYYPPRLTGLRGSHPGSYESAHERARSGKSDWGEAEDKDEVYDLVIVGAGISGLSAARFYQKKYGEDKKILILDNHDDFGGHAKRNEHTVDGAMKIGYGGAQTMESPSRYGTNTKEILDDLNVKPDDFYQAYDRNFYKDQGLEYMTYFNKRTFGEDKVVPCKIGNYAYVMDGVGKVAMEIEDAIEHLPLNDKAREQILFVMKGGDDPLKDIPIKERRAYLENTLYFDVLRDKFGVTEPLVFEIFRSIPNDLESSGADVLSAMEAIWSGPPGFSPEELPALLGEDWGDDNDEDYDPYIHHFPDGNASIARLLVRKLIPEVASGNTMHDVVLAKFDYDKLDREENNVTIRLNSTVVEVKHDGDVEKSDQVTVKYINEGKTCQVVGKHVVMACYNMMIPHIVPGLPEEQYKALRRSTKSPLVYTTVGLKNLKPWKEKKIAIAACPGNWHQIVFVDYPVSMGGYNYATSEDDPIVINMIWIPYSKKYGVPPREQFKETRAKLLEMSFDKFEKEVKSHLTGMLEGTDFDAEKDISSITVNRWSHGYAWSGNQLFEPDMRENAKVGRAKFGRITIANSDAQASAIMHAAIDQAKRAVDEIVI